MAKNKYGCCPCDDDNIGMDEVIEVPTGGDVDPAMVEKIVKDYLDEYLKDNPPGGTPGEPGEPGKDGEDGVSPVVTVSEIEGGHRITITDAFGQKTVDVLDGKDGTPGKDGDPGEPGEPGEPGKDGRGIVSVTRTDGTGAAGTIDTYTIEYTDGTTTTFTVYNGKDGADGLPGQDGQPGQDGKTPEKGVDYFTDEEIAEVAQQAAQMVSISQVTPEQVVFPEGLRTNYALGKVKLVNGSAELVPVGGTLANFFDVFKDERNPATTQPSVTITSSEAKAYEVGTVITPSYSASLKPGSYTYGPETGIVATKWEVKDSAGNTADTPSGTMPNLVITGNTSYRITATATHGDGTVPKTNNGNEYPDGQIKAGTKSASTSTAITGYRNSFYGTLTEKGELTSAVIRSLNMSGKALSNGSSFDIEVPVGALRVVIAYPATLRDLSSVKDVNGMSAEISTGFTPQTVAVSGANGYEAIDYKVYVMDFANANDTANTYTVTI